MDPLLDEFERFLGSYAEHDLECPARTLAGAALSNPANCTCGLTLRQEELLAKLADRLSHAGKQPDAASVEVVPGLGRPTFVEFTNLISNDHPDDDEWVFFWSDVHDGLAFRSFPTFWAEASARRPGGTVREVIDAWPADELKRLWRTNMFRGR